MTTLSKVRDLIKNFDMTVEQAIKTVREGKYEETTYDYQNHTYGNN